MVETRWSEIGEEAASRKLTPGIDCYGFQISRRLPDFVAASDFATSRFRSAFQLSRRLPDLVVAFRFRIGFPIS